MQGRKSRLVPSSGKSADTTATALQPAARRKLQQGHTKFLAVASLLYTAAWLLSVTAGVLLKKASVHDEGHPLRRDLPLVFFDDILRRYGPLLPFVALAFRWWGNALAQPTKGMRRAAHFAEAFSLYLGLTLLRIVLYTMHSTGILHWLHWGRPHHKSVHLMSDHLLLGASIGSIFCAEASLAAVDLRRAQQKKCSDRIRSACTILGLIVSTAFYILTVGDMFYTARYFHDRSESVGAALLGLVLFQVPLAYWLLSANT